MMSRSWRRFMRVAVATAFCLPLCMAAVGTVHAASAIPHTKASAPTYCYDAVVTLHGTDAPTIQCLLKDKPAPGTAMADTATYPCGPSMPTPWIQIYQDNGYGGATICFVGTGFVNLTNFNINIVETWNDQESSFKANSYGIQYWDTNGNGAQCDFYYGYRVSWIDTICGKGWNDNASSIEILGT